MDGEVDKKNEILNVPFVKIYASILDSTIWLEPLETKVLWITLLAMADGNGCIRSSVPGLAHRANIPLEACRAALGTLQAPDPESTTPDEEGRRVRLIEGGWQIINHRKYRNFRSKKQVQDAGRQKKKYDRDKRENSRTSRTEGEVEVYSSSYEEDDPLPPTPQSEPTFEGEGEQTEIPAEPVHADFMRTWNALAKECGLRECRTMTDKRRQSLKARLADPDWRRDYPEALERLRGIRWIRGNSKYQPRGIDWFLQSETVNDTLEGKNNDHRTRLDDHRPEDDDDGPFDP